MNDDGGGADPATQSGLPVGDLLFSGPPTVDLVPPASALAVGAHPDDIEFGCGATLAKWAAAGCRVEYLVLTDGSKGSWDESADLDRLIEERAAESRAAAAVIRGAAGASAGRSGSGGRSGSADDAEGDVHFLGRVDGELVDGPAERREVARLIRTLRPEALLGHDPWRRYRLHPDHRAAGFLTIGALVAARDPHFFPELGLGSTPTSSPSPLGGRPAEPPGEHRRLRGGEDRRAGLPRQPGGEHLRHCTGRRRRHGRGGLRVQGPPSARGSRIAGRSPLR